MRSIPTLLAAVFLATAPAAAMTFSLDGDTVRAAGPIGQGDAERLRSFFGHLERDELNHLWVTVALDSPGGNLMEGMRIGMAIREAGVPTLVRRWVADGRAARGGGRRLCSVQMIAKRVKATSS